MLTKSVLVSTELGTRRLKLSDDLEAQICYTRCSFFKKYSVQGGLLLRVLFEVPHNATLSAHREVYALLIFGLPAVCSLPFVSHSHEKVPVNFIIDFKNPTPLHMYSS